MRNPASMSSRATFWLAPVITAFVTFAIALSLHPPLPLTRDALAYSMTAQRLLRTGVFAYSPLPPDQAVAPNAIVTPGYPLFLAGVQMVAGGGASSAEAALVATRAALVALQFALALGIVAAIAFAGRSIAGRRVGFTAGMLGALYLPFGWAASVALSEQLGTFLFVLQLVVALRVTKPVAEPGWKDFAVFGLLTGGVALVRPALVLWAIVPFAWLAWRRTLDIRRFVRYMVVSGLVAMLVFAPWVVRNGVTLRQFIPLNENAGRPLFDSTGGGELTPEEQRVFDAALASGLNESSAYGVVGRARLKAAFAADPVEFVRWKASDAFSVITHVWVAPADVYWEAQNGAPLLPAEGFDRASPSSLDSASTLMLWYQWLLLALALVGALFVRRFPRLLIAASMPVYVAAVHMTTLFILRYFYPAMPAVIVIAGAGAVGAFESISRRLGQPHAS